MVTRDKRTEYYEKQLHLLWEDFNTAKQIGDPVFASNIAADAVSLLNDTESLFGSDKSFFDYFKKSVESLITEADAFVIDLEYGDCEYE